jgi:glutamyl-tRNA reductase
VAAEGIVQAEAARYERLLKTLDAVPVIRAVRDQADDSRRTRSSRRADSSKPADRRKRYWSSASTLTNKLLHAPSAGLRQAGEAGDAELMQAARKLFGL